MNKITVGQSLWWVPSRQNATPHKVTVTKVGRKWLHLSNYQRIDTITLVADGGDYSPEGQCYLSEVHYKELCALKEAWHQLTKDLHQIGRPDDLTLADIHAARVLLKLS